MMIRFGRRWSDVAWEMNNCESEPGQTKAIVVRGTETYRVEAGQVKALVVRETETYKAEAGQVTAVVVRETETYRVEAGQVKLSLYGEWTVIKMKAEKVKADVVCKIDICGKMRTGQIRGDVLLVDLYGELKVGP